MQRVPVRPVFRLAAPWYNFLRYRVLARGGRHASCLSFQKERPGRAEGLICERRAGDTSSVPALGSVPVWFTYDTEHLESSALLAVSRTMDFTELQFKWVHGPCR